MKLTINRKAGAYLLGIVLALTVCFGCRKETPKEAPAESELPEPQPVPEQQEEIASAPEPGLLDRLTLLDLEEEKAGVAIRELVEEVPDGKVDETIRKLEQELLPPDWRTETLANVNRLIAERDAAIAAAKAEEEQYGNHRVSAVTEGMLYLDGVRHGMVRAGADQPVLLYEQV